MGLSPGACEILEPKEEVDPIKHSRRTNSHRSGSKVDKNTGKLPMEHKYSIEDDLNRLFETINLRSSARGFVPSEKNLSRKDSFKRPIRVGVTQASSIGISESVTLKQALRGLCINHASEMAAMKRLSKPTGLLGASEAGAIKRLYRAVVVDVSESGLPLHEGKGSSVEISLGPDKGKLNTTKKVSVSLQVPQAKSASSTSHSSRLAVATTSKVSMDKPPQKDGDDPVQVELTGEASIVKPEQKGKLKNVCDSITVKKALEMDEVVPASREVESSTSMPERGQNVNSPHLSSSTTDKEANKSAGNSPLVVKPFSRNGFFRKKKGKDSTSPSDCSSTQCGEVKVESKTKKGAFQREKFNQKKVEKESTLPAHSNANSTMDVCTSNTDIESSKPGFQSLNCDVITADAEVSEISRSTENGEISQGSKSIVADYSSSTTITEESNIAGPAFSGTRPHMSKDMRWHAIRRVEMQHGSLGLRHFKLLKQLGSGDIGTVYLAELTGTSCLFAVKVMDIEFLACRKKIPRAQTEREILQMLDHPFLPTLFAHFTTDKFSCLAMEYCPGGDLHILRQRQSGRSFSEQAARFYVAEVLLALEYLHMLGVVYRDLKPENILIREDGHIMLTDFDLSLRCTVSPTLLKSSLSIVEPARKISGPCMESSCIDPLCIQPSWVQVPCFTPKLVSTVAKTRKQKSEAATLVSQLPQLVAEPTNARSNSFVGTHEYLAPEIIKGEGHGNAVDWWTFGIFLYELLYGKTPFKGSGNEDTLANVVLHSLKFPESPQISFQARDLIRGLLVKEPENRLGSVKGATEIRQHPFFEGLNWALIRCTIPPKFPNSCEPVVCLSNSKDSNCMEIQTTGGEQLEFQLF